MQLGSKMAAGDYVLQVIVTDNLAKDKYRVATQSMDFELQKMEMRDGHCAAPLSERE